MLTGLPVTWISPACAPKDSRDKADKAPVANAALLKPADEGVTGFVVIVNSSLLIDGH
jgi:hypothetical protein